MKTGLAIAMVIGLGAGAVSLWFLYQAVAGGPDLPDSLVLVFPGVLTLLVITATVVLIGASATVVTAVIALSGVGGSARVLRMLALAMTAAMVALGALWSWLLWSSPALPALAEPLQARWVRWVVVSAIAAPIPWIAVLLAVPRSGGTAADGESQLAARIVVWCTGVALLGAAMTVGGATALAGSSGDYATAANVEPANPRASAEARAVLEYLYSIGGRAIIAGQHNPTGVSERFSNEVRDIAGRAPGLWGSDFSYTHRVALRPEMVETAIRQWKAGSLVTIMYHMPRPMDPPASPWESVQGNLDDGQWRALLTPGTELHRQWLDHIDAVAEFLKELRDARVPVLWRPFHEMNGGWFWWGELPGRNGSARLWRLMYHRFVSHHELDNLLWVWSPGAPNAAGPFSAYYPGHDVVDVLGMDTSGGPYLTSHHDQLAALAEGRPIALGESGPLPDPERLRREQARWVWFMTWSQFLMTRNDTPTVRAVHNHPFVLTREDLEVEVGPRGRAGRGLP